MTSPESFNKDIKRVQLLLVAVVTVLCALCGHTAAAESKPNIVLFLVDDMGWMDCGVYGSQYYESPNMDRFATQAMRFTDAYAVPLCSPTRASILTGQYSSRHRITSASGHRPPNAATRAGSRILRATRHDPRRGVSAISPSLLGPARPRQPAGPEVLAGTLEAAFEGVAG